MSGFLIDTNVISEFVRPQPDSSVIEWLENADPQMLYASVITIGELRLGVEMMATGRRRADLEQWLDEGLPDWFEANLLPITRSIAERWARLTIEARRKGKSLLTADGLIAATAEEYDLSVVTRNVNDFEGLGIPILNPWERK